MESLLNTPALQSFDQFFSKKAHSQGVSRTRNIIVRLATREGQKKDLTLRDIVTYAYSVDPKKVRAGWLEMRECGERALEYIDEWLESLELRRGMKP